MDELFDRIAALERELESEVNHARQNWRYRVEAGRVRFERDVRAVHRRLRHGIWRFLGESSLSSLVTAPVIYSLVVPIALLDLWITVYQAVCFRAYGIARVKRSSYIVVDRQHLAYLNAIEKLNCVYCGYANGVFAYVREVAGRTEQYWCPIRHARAVRGPHPRYRHFIDYGDAEGYRKRWLPLRNELKDR
jgi:ABC-type multidrug transport system fused ATPase/permease subunit